MVTLGEWLQSEETALGVEISSKSQNEMHVYRIQVAKSELELIQY